MKERTEFLSWAFLLGLLAGVILSFLIPPPWKW